MRNLALAFFCFMLIMSTLSAQNNVIFGGGIDDGNTSHHFAQPSSNAIFIGGTGDGNASGKFAQNTNGSIFNGGLMMVMLNLIFHRLPTIRFSMVVWMMALMRLPFSRNPIMKYFQVELMMVQHMIDFNRRATISFSLGE